MLLAPKPGHQYRHIQTGQLVPAEGFQADVCDLDIVRALECGDLIPVEGGAKPAKAKRAPAKGKTPPAAPAAEAPAN